MFTIIIEKLANHHIRINVYLRGFLLRYYIVLSTALIDVEKTDSGFTCRMARRVEAQAITFTTRTLADDRKVAVSKKLGAKQMFATMLHMYRPTRKIENSPLGDLIPEFIR